jgi:hypothetical protein
MRRNTTETLNAYRNDLERARWRFWGGVLGCLYLLAAGLLLAVGR